MGSHRPALAALLARWHLVRRVASLSRRERRLYAALQAQLCSFCQRFANVERLIAKRWDLEPNASNSNESDDAFWEFSLGTKSDLTLRAQTCAFCRLVHCAIALDYTRFWPYVVGNVDIGAGDQIIVRSAPDGFGPSLCIDALENIYMQEFRVRMMNPGNRMYSRYQLRHPSRAHSRKLQQPHGCQVSVHLVKDWLDSCDREHGKKCKWTSRPRQGRPLIFIDVLDMRLVEGSLNDAYIALSYVWGQTAMLQSTKAIVSTLMQPGSLRERLTEIPLTIRDAITFTRGLGERFLWTDCLCIVQDDPASKHGQISQMDLVYSCAALTLVSLSGVDANSGLYGVSPNSREPTIVAGVGEASIGLVAFNPLKFDLVNQESTAHGKRAWTYQETLLSRRCLFFNTQTVFFECRTTTAHDLIMPKKRRTWDIDGKNPLLQIISGESAVPPATVAFDVYRALVLRYSARKLSFDSDVVNAFTGLTTFLNAFYPESYACALPLSRLDEAICWYGMNRTDESTGGPKLSSRRTMTPGGAQYVCPSWTWAGWHIKVLWFSGLRANNIGGVQLGPLTFPHPIPKPPIYDLPNSNTPAEWTIDDRRTVVADIMPDSNCLHFWAPVVPCDDMTFRLYGSPFLSRQDTTYIHIGDSRCGIIYSKNIPEHLNSRGEGNATYELVVLSNEILYAGWNSGPHCLRDLLELDRERNYNNRLAGVLVMLLKRIGNVSQRMSIGLFNAPVMWSLRPEMKAVWLT